VSINRLPNAWRSSAPTRKQPGTAVSFAGSKRSEIRTILVPLDGDSHGERALPLAASIARQAGARLRLLHVDVPVRNDFHPSYTSVDRGPYHRQLDYVRRIARQVADASGIRVDAECLQDPDISEGICRAAERGVDLVVAVSHGHSWLERVWRPGTMHKLIDRLAPPLLILRGNGLSVSIAPERWLRRMLVPLDGSRQAEQVFDPMIALGSLYEADYSLLKVVSYRDLHLAAYDELEMQRKQVAAQAYLSEAMYRLKRRSQPAAAHVAVTDDSVAKAIAARAQASNADCIALAHGKRSGLQRWFQRSVTHRVLQRSSVPLLIIKQTAK
jgi:nucleotide-binding universal stress UspA family protein